MAIRSTKKRSISDPIGQAADIFLSKFADKLPVGEETIGIEPEILAVNKNGDAVSREVVERVFKDFVSAGWDKVVDEGTRKTVGITRKTNGQTESLGTDVGYAIIEAQIPPARTLHEAMKLRAKTLKPLVAAFAKHGIYLLGYGVLPNDLPRRELLAPKGRYIFFERDSSNVHIHPTHGVDLHFFTMSAAAHTHIGVEKDRVIPASNVLNALAGVFIFIGANSPIWKGKIDERGNRAVREWFWDAGWGRRRPNQTGVLRPLKDMNDYVRHVTSFEPQMIKVGREYLSLLGTATTIGDLLRKGRASAKTVNGDTVKIAVLPEYILFAGGFAWYTARPAWPGTIESRVSCQQPPDAPLAMSALALGLVANIRRAQEFVAKHPFSYWKKLRTEAMFLGFRHKDARELCVAVLALAREGLRMRGHKEEVFLAPLYTRLKENRAPAERAIEIFKKGGVPALVEALAITQKSLAD